MKQLSSPERHRERPVDTHDSHELRRQIRIVIREQFPDMHLPTYALRHPSSNPPTDPTGTVFRARTARSRAFLRTAWKRYGTRLPERWRDLARSFELHHFRAMTARAHMRILEHRWRGKR